MIINHIDNNTDDFDNDALSIYLEETEDVEISYIIVDVPDDNITQNNTQQNNTQQNNIPNMFKNELDIQLYNLITHGYIPKYLYPNETIKDGIYIKLISYHLYRQYIYRKMSDKYYKSNYINLGTYSKSKLRHCINANELKENINNINQLYPLKSYKSLDLLDQLNIV